MSMKKKFNNKKNFSPRVSVFVTDNKENEPINIGEIDMKISKLNSMIHSVERRIEAHERRLSFIYESNEGREVKEKISSIEHNIYLGQ